MRRLLALAVLLLPIVAHASDAGFYSPRHPRLSAVRDGRNLWTLHAPTIEQEALFRHVAEQIQWDKLRGEEFDREAWRLLDRLMALRGRTVSFQ
jgi:hypothetical protein